MEGLVLIIVYFSQVIQVVKMASTIVFPLFLGFMIAYVVNILMRFLERHFPLNVKQTWLLKVKRALYLFYHTF